MSDSEMISTVLNSLESEYKVTERYAMLKIVEKKWVPLFQASHEGWLSQGDFIPAMLKAVGENVHEAQKLEVVRLIEEKRYEDKKNSGKLVLEIAKHYIANKREDVGAARGESQRFRSPGKGRNAFFSYMHLLSAISIRDFRELNNPPPKNSN